MEVMEPVVTSGDHQYGVNGAGGDYNQCKYPGACGDISVHVQVTELVVTTTSTNILDAFENLK